MNDEEFQIRQLPAQDRRVETGPVRFGDDWCGLFIRGDNAMGFAMALQRLRVEHTPDVLTIQEVEYLVELLESCQEHKRK